VPDPLVDTLSSNSLGGDPSASNAAVTVCSVPPVRVQVPVPEHPPPLQPTKLEPGSGTAVRTTVCPASNGAEHSEPQEIPAGELVTLPVPVPAFCTVISFGGGGVPPSTTKVCSAGAGLPKVGCSSSISRVTVYSPLVSYSWVVWSEAGRSHSVLLPATN